MDSTHLSPSDAVSDLPPYRSDTALSARPAGRHRAAPRHPPGAAFDATTVAPWQTDRPVPVMPDGVTTGFAALDAQLPGGGWPRRALTEVLLPRGGIGELRLLAPALAATVRAGRLVMLFDPPAGLSAWALAGLGLDASQLLPIDGRSALRPEASSLWALEQALKSGHVGAVLAWLPLRLRAGQLRRLRLAAQRHDGPAFVLREEAPCQRPGAAPLRLALQADGADRLALRILERHGAPPGDVLRLDLPPALPPELALAAWRRTAVSKASGALGQAAPAAAAAGAAGGHAASADVLLAEAGRVGGSPIVAPGSGASAVPASSAAAIASADADAAATVVRGDNARAGIDPARSQAAERDRALLAALHAPLRSAVFVDLGAG